MIGSCYKIWPFIFTSLCTHSYFLQPVSCDKLAVNVRTHNTFSSNNHLFTKTAWGWTSLNNLKITLAWYLMVWSIIQILTRSLYKQKRMEICLRLNKVVGFNKLMDHLTMDMSYIQICFLFYKAKFTLNLIFGSPFHRQLALLLFHAIMEVFVIKRQKENRDALKLSPVSFILQSVKEIHFKNYLGFLLLKNC